MYRTHDQVAQEFIAEGKRRNITERGQVICIATGLVESSLTVYANSKVAASMALPHDAVGSDGMSVGPLQQQVKDTGNGWWWGDAATCMDPTKSAGLFYDRLVTHDYNGPNSPGSYAQAVQDSEYPDRYDERMADAQAIYDRLSGQPAPEPVVGPTYKSVNLIGERAISNNSQSRNGTTIDLQCGHTTEGAGGLDLVTFMEGASVSYHTLIDNDLDGNTVYYLVDTDRASWSVLNANNRSINYVIGRSKAAWTRQQWIDNARNAVRIMAWEMVQDARKYGIPIRIQAPPYNADPPCQTDHAYVTHWLGIGTHTDLGPNFIWDLLTEDVNYYAGNGDDMPLINGPSRSIYRDDDNPIGDGTEVEYQNNGMIHESLIERLAGLGEQASIDKVTAVAQGSAPVQLPDWTRARAQAVLDAMPKAKTVRKPTAAS